MVPFSLEALIKGEIKSAIVPCLATLWGSQPQEDSIWSSAQRSACPPQQLMDSGQSKAESREPEEPGRGWGDVTQALSGPEALLCPNAPCRSGRQARVTL